MPILVNFENGAACIYLPPGYSLLNNAKHFGDMVFWHMYLSVAANWTLRLLIALKNENDKN